MYNIREAANVLQLALRQLRDKTTENRPVEF